MPRETTLFFRRSERTVDYDPVQSLLATVGSVLGTVTMENFVVNIHTSEITMQLLPQSTTLKKIPKSAVT